MSVLAASVAALGGCDVWSNQSQPAAVVVGVDLDLTGAGLVYERALRLAVEQVNTRRLAGDDRRLELRVLDNRGEPALSTQHLASLAADPAVAAVITAGCDTCVVSAAGTVAVPVIALTGDETVATPVAERRWVFRLGPNAADNADILSAAMHDADVETVAVIYTDDPYGRDGARWFTAAADRDDLDITTTVPLPATASDSDVAELVHDVLDGRPGRSTVGGQDAVLLWTGTAQTSTAARALVDAGFRGEVYVDMMAVDELFGPGPLAGAYLVTTATAVAAERVAASPAAAARQEWVLRYVSAYGGYHLHSPFAADALLVLADAIHRADSTDREAVRDRLESVRLDGITGPIRLTAEQHSGLLPGSLVVLSADTDRWQ